MNTQLLLVLTLITSPINDLKWMSSDFSLSTNFPEESLTFDKHSSARSMCMMLKRSARSIPWLVANISFASSISS
jgi:hypothetical protein